MSVARAGKTGTAGAPWAGISNSVLSPRGPMVASW